jgi:hypothetical protein
MVHAGAEMGILVSNHEIMCLFLSETRITRASDQGSGEINMKFRCQKFSIIDSLTVGEINKDH